MPTLLLPITLLLVLLCSNFSTPLEEQFFTAARVGDVELLISMLNSGFDVSAQDAKGNTAIIISSGRGKVEALRVLISHGANVESVTNKGLFQGKSALMWASSQGRDDAVSLLLQAGASIHREIEVGVFQGKTALMWASSQGREGVVRILLNAGADVDYFSKVGNFKGKNALMWASSQGRVEAVSVLLEANADVNHADNDGITALMWAAGSERDDSDGHKKGLLEKASKGQVEVVKLLLRYGASPDSKDNDGITAVMYAAFHGHSEAVQALLVAGADPNCRNKEGKTAIDLARGAGHLDTIKAINLGPNIMELSITELLNVSVCGWLLSVLRHRSYPTTRSTGSPVTSPPSRSQSFSSFSLATSCKILTEHGLDGLMSDFLLVVSASSVDDVVSHLGIPFFAGKIRAKSQLNEFVRRYHLFLSSDGNDKNNTRNDNYDSFTPDPKYNQKLDVDKMTNSSSCCCSNETETTTCDNNTVTLVHISELRTILDQQQLVISKLLVLLSEIQNNTTTCSHHKT